MVFNFNGLLAAFIFVFPFELLVAVFFGNFFNAYFCIFFVF